MTEPQRPPFPEADFKYRGYPFLPMEAALAVVLPPDLTTKLAAVNVLLQTISQSPVASLDVSTSVDVASAVQAIDEVDRALQTKGWHWNREDNWQLSPDESGGIALPANYLWVSNAYWSESCSPCRVSERGRQLYNRDTHTYTFTEPVTVDMIVKLEWEEMPEYARQYITLAAADNFQSRLQGTPNIQRVTEKQIEGAMALIEQREDEADEKNNVGGNQFVSHNLSSHGVRRRY